MAKVWVLAESSGGKASGLTLELLTKARELGDVEAVAWEDAEAMAGDLGAHGATAVHSVDIGGGLAGVPVAAAIAAAVEAGNGPDILLIGQTYDGRDVAGRLSAKLDKPVLTNAVGLTAGDPPVAQHAIFGGATIVEATFTGSAPYIYLVRPKSFAPEPSGGGAASVSALAAPDAGLEDPPKLAERLPNGIREERHQPVAHVPLSLLAPACRDGLLGDGLPLSRGKRCCASVAAFGGPQLG